MPVTTGEAIDVPCLRSYVSVGTDENTLTPRATTSGFTRPSFAGPRELRLAICTVAGRLPATAPTAMTFLALAVTPSVSKGIDTWWRSDGFSQPAGWPVSGLVPLHCAG